MLSLRPPESLPGACCVFAGLRAAHAPTAIPALPILDGALASPAVGTFATLPDGRTSLDGSMRNKLLTDR